MARVQSLSVLKSLPVRPIWLLRIFAASAIKRVPAYGLAAGVTLFLAAQILAWALGNGIMGAAGWWSATVLLTSLGVVLGSLAGLAAASGAALVVAEEDVRNWLMQYPESEGDRLFPRIEMEQLRNGYEDAIESMYGSTIGRIPLPGFISRKIQAKFRHAVLDEFLANCGERGVTAVGFSEVRDFVLLKALPIVTQPAHTQCKVWKLLLVGLLIACAGTSVLVGLLANHVDPPWLVAGVLGTAGVLVLGLGLPRASRHAAPWKYRLGILILGAGLIAWPIAWIQLWALDLGMVWIVILTATLWTFHLGVRMVFLDANRLVFRPGANI